MDRSANFLIGTCCVVFGTYAFWNYLWYPTIVIDYRLTLEASTPDGPKTGSGVIEVSYASTDNFIFGPFRDNHVIGEAVPLDLGRGKLLFVTLTSNASGRNDTPGKWDGAVDALYLPIKVFKFQWYLGKERKLRYQVRNARAAGTVNVPFRSLPTIVTFKDLNDPKSVVLVQPENLAAIFGEGYSLSRATIELTDDEPTRGSLSKFGFIIKLKTQSTLSGLEKFDQKKPGEINYLTNDIFFSGGTQ